MKHKSDTTGTVVLAREVDKAYRRGSTTTPVLRSVDLEVRAGECVFLAGPSGSGKTTLLSILGCILSSDSGLVQILGNDVSRLSNRARTILRRDRIGFVFQKFHLIRGLTALENVCVPLTLKGVSRRRARERAMSLLTDVGLAEKAHSHPKNLSTGQCQRIALSRALATDPDLILADEPTASLDAESGLRAMELLRNLASREGKTAIVVTHDPRIYSFADRICHMENGRLISEDTPQTVQQG